MQQDPLALSSWTHTYAHTWSYNRAYWTQAFIEQLQENYPAAQDILFIDAKTGHQTMAADAATTHAHFRVFRNEHPEYFEKDGSLKKDTPAKARQVSFSSGYINKTVVMADSRDIPGSEQERWQNILLHETCHLIIQGGVHCPIPDGTPETMLQKMDILTEIRTTAFEENIADVGAYLIDLANTDQTRTASTDLSIRRAENALHRGDFSHLSSLALAKVEKDRQTGKLKDLKPEDVSPLAQDYALVYSPDEKTILQLNSLRKEMIGHRKRPRGDAADKKILKTINAYMHDKHSTPYTRFVCATILDKHLNTEWASDTLKGKFWRASRKEAKKLSADFVSGEIAEIYFDEKKAQEKRALKGQPAPST